MIHPFYILFKCLSKEDIYIFENHYTKNKTNMHRIPGESQWNFFHAQKVPNFFSTHKGQVLSSSSNRQRGKLRWIIKGIYSSRRLPRHCRSSFANNTVSAAQYSRWLNKGFRLLKGDETRKFPAIALNRLNLRKPSNVLRCKRVHEDCRAETSIFTKNLRNNVK